MTRFLADCHLHFEGSLPRAFLSTLAARAAHPFQDDRAFEAARRSVRDGPGFLALYAEVCRLFRRPEDYLEAADALARQLQRDGVAYAEVYISPQICRRVGLDPQACLEAAHHGFSEAVAGADCRILLDAVRHWGPESASRVLDLYERRPLESILGFGMGGDENFGALEQFAPLFARARALGLKTSVHAGEWAGPESVAAAVKYLQPDRIDHGVRAVEDRDLLERLRNDGITLWVAPTGNLATGIFRSWRAHPLPQLLAGGARVALSADDPLLFGTSTMEEYRRVAQRCGLRAADLRKIAEQAWRGAFCADSRKEAGLARLPETLFSGEEGRRDR